MNQQLKKICDLSKTLRSSSGELLSETAGGGDPEAIVKDWGQLIEKHLDIPKNSKVLDYGCGIGRLALSLLEYSSDLSYLGIDIVPEFIEFGKKNITEYNENFKFELIDDKNPLYQKYRKSDKEGPDSVQFQDIKYRPDFIFALSLFSHLKIKEATKILTNISSCMHDDSVVFLTAFINDFEAKNAIKSEKTFPFNPKTTHFHQSYIEDSYNGPLSAIGFERSTLEELFFNCDLVVSQQINGFWRGLPYASVKSLQDILILKKRRKVPDDFDGDLYLERYEDIKNSGMSPAFHLLAFGFDEKRELK